ncbi:MAG: hypothetical protein JO261_10095 [Alphaproteobacteria bacterium]|nr:hypothetical protein [Alphaproteobacteria bacterium]MBV9694039.1 hypothetical protein [Alphaproteobacteria bacterium]
MAETANHSYAEGDSRTLAIVVYVLYLIGWPCVHLSTLGGLILAYIKRDDARGTVWESHFSNAIHTFWITLLLMIVGVPLCFVVVGIPIVVFAVVWFFYRTIKGLIRAIDHQPYL